MLVEDYASAWKGPTFSPFTVPATVEHFMWYGVSQEGPEPCPFW